MKFKNIFILIFTFLFVFSTFSFATDEPTVFSEAAILIDANTGKSLYEKNATQQMYPASTTKIMTAILTIENCELDETVTVNYNAISTIPSGYSIAELVEGEELTVKQLLEVLLVHSANDAANVLAMHVGGSIDSFVSMMNSKAQEIGCTNTNFTNTYGKQEDTHYTTAKDLALIAQYCMKNSTFRSFVSQPECTITATNKHEPRNFKNTNDLIRPSSDYYYEYAIGIKTGYTSEAKNCLISASSKDGFETISVILGADKAPDGASARYVDSINLFEYAYNNYSIKELAHKDDVITQITIPNGTKETKELDVLLVEDITALTNISNTDANSPAITINNNLSAPLAAGTIVGSVTYNIDNIEYKADLVAAHDVEKSDALIIILQIGLAIFILIILGKLFLSSKTKKHKKKKMYRDNIYRF